MKIVSLARAVVFRANLGIPGFWVLPRSNCHTRHVLCSSPTDSLWKTANAEAELPKLLEGLECNSPLCISRQQPWSDAKSHAPLAAIVQFLICHFTVVTFAVVTRFFKSLKVAQLQSEFWRDLFLLRIFLQKMVRNTPRKCWAFIVWVRRNPTKFPPNISAKNQEKFTDELLQESREKKSSFCGSWLAIVVV